jgi:predicted exporter
LAVAVAAPVTGLFAIVGLAAGFLTAAFFWAGTVVGPPAHASAAMAKAAAKVRIFRMISGLVYQEARTKQ